jgi:hypothetical protein
MPNVAGPILKANHAVVPVSASTRVVLTEEIVLLLSLCWAATAASPVFQPCSYELSSHLANGNYLFGARHTSGHINACSRPKEHREPVLREPGHLRIVRSTTPRKVTVMAKNSRPLVGEYQRLAVHGV